MALAAPTLSAEGRHAQQSKRVIRQAVMSAGMHVGNDPLQPKAAGLKTVKFIQQVITLLMFEGTLFQQPMGRSLNESGHVDRMLEGERVSITRTSIVPKCGLGRMSQCKSLMLSTRLV